MDNKITLKEFKAFLSEITDQDQTIRELRGKLFDDRKDENFELNKVTKRFLRKF